MLEFKIIGAVVWLLMCVVGFNACLGQLNLPSDNSVATGVGGILFIVVANVFLARHVISSKKENNEVKKNEA